VRRAHQLRRADPLVGETHPTLTNVYRWPSTAVHPLNPVGSAVRTSFAAPTH